MTNKEELFIEQTQFLMPLDQEVFTIAHKTTNIQWKNIHTQREPGTSGCWKKKCNNILSSFFKFEFQCDVWYSILVGQIWVAT